MDLKQRVYAMRISHLSSRAGVTILCLLISAALVGPSSLAQGASTEQLQAATALIQAEKWEEARIAYTAITQQDPSVEQPWAMLGFALRNLKQYDESIRAYERAIAINPNSVQALAGAAITQGLKGDETRAMELLSTAVDAGLPPQALRQNPAFAALRENPGYEAIVALADKRSRPCEQGGVYDAFDFWVGEWDVYVGGQKRAVNRISKEMGGCIVRERYENQGGYTGESLNYFDPESKRWKQHWVDGSGNIIYYIGESPREGLMEMAGTSVNAQGALQQARVSWTRLENGWVHHYSDQTVDGKNWVTVFDGTYVPLGEPGPDSTPPPPPAAPQRTDAN